MERIQLYETSMRSHLACRTLDLPAHERPQILVRPQQTVAFEDLQWRIRMFLRVAEVEEGEVRKKPWRADAGTGELSISYVLQDALVNDKQLPCLVYCVFMFDPQQIFPVDILCLSAIGPRAKSESVFFQPEHRRVASVKRNNNEHGNTSS